MHPDILNCNAMARFGKSATWMPVILRDGKCFDPRGLRVGEMPSESRTTTPDEIQSELDASGTRYVTDWAAA